MINGFSGKKNKRFSTLGEKLKQARLAQEVSFSDAENATKVRAKFLSALENGRWDLLPQEVYTRGFVQAYARFLELDLSDTLLDFDREVAAFRRIQGPSDISYSKTYRETGVLITPKVLAYAAVSFFVVTMFSYIIYQVAGFAGSPSLKIVRPNNNVIVESDNISLEGITDSDSSVSVNDERVPVTSEGKFLLEMKLHRGVNVISVRAVNKAKKESAETYTIEYRPKTASVSSDDSNIVER